MSIREPKIKIANKNCKFDRQPRFDRNCSIREKMTLFLPFFVLCCCSSSVDAVAFRWPHLLLPPTFACSPCDHLLLLPRWGRPLRRPRQIATDSRTSDSNSGDSLISIFREIFHIEVISLQLFVFYLVMLIC